jgi:hypothetical protein
MGGVRLDENRNSYLEAITLPVRMTACSRIEAETSAALSRRQIAAAIPLEIQGGTSSPMMRCLAREGIHDTRENEVAMATKQHTVASSKPRPAIFG